MEGVQLLEIIKENYGKNNINNYSDNDNDDDDDNKDDDDCDDVDDDGKHDEWNDGDQDDDDNNVDDDVKVRMKNIFFSFSTPKSSFWCRIWNALYS